MEVGTRPRSASGRGLRTLRRAVRLASSDSPRIRPHLTPARGPLAGFPAEDREGRLPGFPWPKIFTVATNLERFSASDWSIQPTSSRIAPTGGWGVWLPNSSGIWFRPRRFKSQKKATTRGREKKKGAASVPRGQRRDTTRGAGSPSRALRPGREVVGDARPFDAGIRDRPRATRRPPRDPPPPA